MALLAGAIMDEVIGVMNVIRETRLVASHLLLNDQFRGFLGSSGPSQITYRKTFNLAGVSNIIKTFPR